MGCDMSEMAEALLVMAVWAGACIGVMIFVGWVFGWIVDDEDRE